MNKRKIFSSLIIISLVLLLIIICNKSTNKSHQVSIKDNKIDIAIVNEDIGYEKEQNVYLLGTQYVNSLDDSKNKHFELVSRDLAENGLKKHDYELVMYLLTTFSKTIMEFEKYNPEKLDLNYKIQARSEEESKEIEQIAKNMINELNNRLTTMYTLGILDSLYDAKKSVASINQGQSMLATNYKNNLQESISETTSELPNIFSVADSLAEENSSLQSEYEDYRKEQNQILTQTAKDNEERIVQATMPLEEQIKELQVSKEELVQQMMELDNTELLNVQNELLLGLQTSVEKFSQLPIVITEYEKIFSTYQGLVISGIS